MKKITALIAMLFVAAIVSAVTVIGPYTATMQFGLNRQSRIDFVDSDNSISEKVIFEETGSGKDAVNGKRRNRMGAVVCTERIPSS